jgi:hypothetical protein
MIQVSSTFQPSQGDATKKILIESCDTIDLIPSNDKSDSTAWPCSVFLLYISFGISVTEAAFALIINVWLTRYQHSLTVTGPTIHDRIRKRYEAYTGLMDWRLPMLIESLPMVALLALLLFAVFIRYSVPTDLNGIHIHIPNRGTSFGKIIQRLATPLRISSSPFPFFSCRRPQLLPSFQVLPFIRRSPVSSGSPSESSPTGLSVELSEYALSALSSYAVSRSRSSNIFAFHCSSRFCLHFCPVCQSSLCVKEIQRRRNRRNTQNHAYLAWLLGSSVILSSLRPSPSPCRTCDVDT